MRDDSAATAILFAEPAEGFSAEPAEGLAAEAGGAGVGGAGGPLTALADTSVVARLAGQFAGRGVDVLVIARADAVAGLRTAGLSVLSSHDAAGDLVIVADIIRTAPGPVILAAATLVASDGVIDAAMAGDTVAAFTGAAFAGEAFTGEAGAPLRVERGRVISAGSAWHRVTGPTASFAGLLRIGGASRDAVSAALASAAEQVAPGIAGTLELALVAIVRAGVTVTARGTGGRVCVEVRDSAAARTALARLSGVDEEAVRRRLAVKSDDDLFATYCVSTWSPLLVRIAARLRLSPTGVTWLSVIVCVVAAAAFAHGTRPATVVGALLLYAGFVLDCVDGQLARYTQRFSQFGGWLDAMADRGKEFVVYAGLAVGAARSGVGDVWPLAIAALTLLTVRHMTDGWYGVARDQAVARLAPAPFDVAADAGGEAVAAPGSGAIASLIQAANAPRRSVLHWVKKLMVLPIGERWMLIALCAALADARVAFGALLGWGVVAAVYTFGVRLVRTWSARSVTVGAYDVATYRDDGVFARLLGAIGRGGIPPLPTAAVAAVAGVALIVVQTGVLGLIGRAAVVVATVYLLVQAALAGRHPHTGPLDWLVPAALRAAELTTVVAAGYGLGVPQPLIFTLLGVIALYHYDLTARLDKGGSSLLWRGLGLGWDGRLLVIAIAAMLGRVWPVSAVAIWSGLVGYLVVVFLAGTLVGALSRLSHAEAPAVVRARTPTPRQSVDDQVGSTKIR